MSYVPIKLHPDTSEVFARSVRESIEAYLRDIHAMMCLPLPERGIEAGCNLAIFVCLTSVLSTVARLVNPHEGNESASVKGLLRKKELFPWSLEPPSAVIEEKAACILWDELRHKLVHTTGLPIDHEEIRREKGRKTTFHMGSDWSLLQARKSRGAVGREMARNRNE